MKQIAQPKKVLHVLNSASGGAALSTIGLMDSLRKQGIDACAVCHDSGGQSERDLLSEATQGNVIFAPLYWWNRKIRAKTWKRPLIEANQLRRTGFKRGSTAKVTRFAQDQQADLIHTNTICTPEGGAAARNLGLPHVWHLRELVGPGRPFRLPVEGDRLGRHLAKQCSFLVANSNVTADIVRGWLPDGLLQIVPNGIDISQFAVRQTTPPGKQLVAAMVGSISSNWKKHPLFVDAASQVDPSLDIEFRIYGHDPSQGGTVAGNAYADALHAQIDRLGLRNRFAFPGFMSNPADIMSQIDILVHQADDESFGRVIVEAMAAGIPVVGVRGGGVGEIVIHNETGLLGPPNDATALAKGIDILARDADLRHRMGIAGRERAETTYSLESCAAGILKVYQAAMSRPLSRR